MGRDGGTSSRCGNEFSNDETHAVFVNLQVGRIWVKEEVLHLVI